jgi:hypothetical protein
LHYADREFELTNEQAATVLASASKLISTAVVTVRTDTGCVRFLVGPGIPLWVDERDAAPRGM